VGRIKEMKSITLNRKQVQDLINIVAHFREVEEFTIEQDNSSGIGPIIKVKCELFSKPTTVDITDVESW
jgi:hypothetical protein